MVKTPNTRTCLFSNGSDLGFLGLKKHFWFFLGIFGTFDEPYLESYIPTFFPPAQTYGSGAIGPETPKIGIFGIV